LPISPEVACRETCPVSFQRAWPLESIGGRWEAPPIFSLIQKKDDIDDQEMYRVFNMGICMAVVTAPGDAAMLIREIPGARLIGEVIKQKEGKRVVI